MISRCLDKNSQQSHFCWGVSVFEKKEKMSSEKRPFHTVTFGKRLAQARTSLHLSQETLAEAVGTTSRSIIRWEQGQAFPQQYYRERLYEALQITPEKLFGTSHEEQPSISPSAPLWYVPYTRNPYFTGREGILNDLYEKLHTGLRVSLTQPRVVSGMGGIGKTQTALEYAYRFRSSYQTVVWIGAETPETLFSDYLALAHLFDLSEKERSTPVVVREAVKRWFQNHNGWLLVFDNVENLELLNAMLPDTRQGHILITTRSQIIGTLGSPIDVQKMDQDEGTLFLLRRAKLLPLGKPLEEASPSLLSQANALVTLLDGLPLALDQAGAYIEETACNISDYIERYETRQHVLLNNRGTLSSHHPASVTATFSLSLQQVEQASPAAMDLLRLCSFLHSEAIPEEFIIQTGNCFGPLLQALSADLLLLDAAIKELRRFSLIHREAETRTLSIHRLLQEIIRDKMDGAEHKQWIERTLQAMLQIFPDHKNVTSYNFGNQSHCQQYLPHALICTALLNKWKVASPEAGEFLYRVAHYLQQSWGSNPQTLPLLVQAVAIAQQVIGKEHATTATYLYVLGIFSMAEKRYSQAEEYLQQALEVRKKVKGTDHPEVAEALEHLANLSCRQGQYTQALLLAQQALTIKEQALGGEHYEVALTLNTLGSISLIKREYTQAQQFFQRALSIAEKTVGAEHLFSAFFLRSLGSLYFSQQKYVQAQDAYQQAFHIFEQKLGQFHPFIAFVLVRLGNISFAQQHYQQAKVFYQKATKIYEKQPIPDVSQLAYCQLCLGELYFVQGKVRFAQHRLQRVLFILEESSQEWPIDYQTIIHCHLLLADRKVKEGSLMQAHTYYQQTLALGEQKLNPQHPLLIRCQNAAKTLI